MHRCLIFLFAMAVLLTGTCHPVLCQEPKEDTGPDTLFLQPVTVMALHPRSGEKEILDLNYSDRLAHDAGDLLTRLSSISGIRKSGAYGFDPVIRGFKYDQINVVYNGAQSATAACPNRMDPPSSQMAPNMIRRVEVFKGPHALRYGNSLGATINFIAPSPSFSNKNHLSGRLSGSWESNGNILRSEAMLGSGSSWYDLGLFASWSSGNDYTTGGGQEVQADFRRGSFGARAGFKLGKKQILQFSGTRNLARDADFAALPMDLREDDTWMFNAEHTLYPPVRTLASWKSTLYGSFVDHRMDNLLKNLDPRMVNAETLASTSNYGIRTEGSWKFDNSGLFTGADLKREQASGNRTREFLMGPMQGNMVADKAWQDARIDRTGIFGEYHWKDFGMDWVFSGRLELNHSSISDPDELFQNLYPESDVWQLNPGISLGMSKKISEKLSTGLWLGRVQRSGSMTEKFINFFPVGLDPYEMLGNPELLPEVNYQADLNFQWKNATSLVSIDLFVARLQDLISSSIDTSLYPRIPSSPGVRRFINFDKAFKTGIEARWSQVLWAGLQHEVNLAYTYGQDLERNDALPEIAPLDLQYVLKGSYIKGRLKPHFSFRHAWKQIRISQEFGETETPAFSQLNLGISIRIHRTIGLATGINNLLNTEYYEHLNRSVKDSEAATPIYAPGRSFYLSFNLDFR